MKKWLILDNSRRKNGDDIVRTILKNRGLKTPKEMDDFLNPSLSQLTLENVHLQKKEIEKAYTRIKKAIADHEPIIVYTDYDVDGVASGTIVWEALHDLGANVMPYVPHRIEEGYGLSQKGIDTVNKENKTKLIITVDHGVTAGDKIGYAKKLGIDVIIIDHHTLPVKLPDAVALIHTTGLCATGIAWFFARFVNAGKSKTKELDLVALATIADMIPLTGVNRILVKFGLEELNRTKRPGLKALIKTSGLKSGNLGIYEVGHMLAPRINASGRLTHALDSLRLLCTRDEARADLLAQNLSTTNRERQIMLEETLIHAKKISNLRSQNSKLIFIAEESYNQGVIGLVAGRLTEEFYRPSIVISKAAKYSKASARSVPGFNIVDAIRSCSELLVDVGGHPMAAGFTVETAKISLLAEKLAEFVDRELTPDRLERVLKIDREIDLADVDLNLLRSLKVLAPFGVGNPEPTFASRHVKVVKIALVGKDKKHLKLTLQPDPKYNVYIGAIGFGLGELYDKLSFDKLIDIAYTISENDWGNHHELQLKLKDVKFPQ